MNAVLAEILVICALALLNGFFAMSEMAMVSASRARLKELAEAGNRSAASACAMIQSPNRLLSTVQIGITLVGVLGGAVGGATLADEIAALAASLPLIGGAAHSIGLAVVVALISLIFLVFGELAPKRIALDRPEKTALLVAEPMRRLSALAHPVVRVLGWMTDAALKLVPGGVERRPDVSEEEVKVLLRQGTKEGVFLQSESEMVQRVLELDQIPVREIMTPKPKIIWLNKEDPHETIWHKIVVSNHSYFPVYEGSRDRVIGIVSLKAIYANLAADLPVNLGDLAERPLIVPENQNAIQLLDVFKQSGKHIALVADEYGGIVGLVTLHDVMEAIVGDFPSQDERLKPSAVRRPDGSWLVDGMLNVDALEELLPGFRLAGPHGEFQTVAGYVVKRFGYVPREGETFREGDYVFEVLDMDGYRVDKVFVMPADKAPPSLAGPEPLP
ncbi:MAG: HlyC/CorC family transporter [Verrucomicrobia bacterium]|nr:HlyC/CorC family transporter [Verrucomicrobiota bacterium]